MQKRSLGRSSVAVSAIGLGCSPLGGGLFQQHEAAMVDVVREALDGGVTFLDTSSNYGMGRSEAIIGRAIRGRRAEVVIATKGGARFTPIARAALAARPLLRPVRALLGPLRRQMNLARDAHKRYDYSARGLRMALEGSLRRLRIDAVDVYQLYNPTPLSSGLDEAFETLERFRAEGKARLVGLSVNQVADAPELLRRWTPDTLQLPVSLLDVAACGVLLPQLEHAGIGVIARSVLAQGLLTDARGHLMAHESSHYSVEQLREREARSRKLRVLAGPHRTLAQAAVRFVLQQPGVSTAIFAATDSAQLQENLRAESVAPLDEQDLREVFTP